MKKTILIIAAILFMGVSIAHATVGGPTYIYDFRYNPADTSVYYTENSSSGRGCPPMLEKLSLTTNQTNTILSCDQGEMLTNVPNGVQAEIAGITKDFKYLTQISLSKNDIRIEIAFTKEEKIPEDDMVVKRDFVATVYQDDQIVAQFPITGCAKEQPFVFGGYAVPGLNKKIILLLSAKRDCWEGGYTYETLQPINATVVDRISASNSYKGLEAFVPSEASLVVFAQTRATPAPVTIPVSQTPTYSNNPFLTDRVQQVTAIVAAAFLLLGVLIGRLIKK